MSQYVSMGATLKCSFGAAPSKLAVIPPNVTGQGPAAANIMDFAPMMNIMPFGMCSSLSNPTVSAATSAALGVLTPMPCVPVTTPWAPGVPSVLIRGQPALHKDSKCNCSWAGVITIVVPATTKNMT